MAHRDPANSIAYARPCSTAILGGVMPCVLAVACAAIGIVARIEIYSVCVFVFLGAVILQILLRLDVVWQRVLFARQMRLHEHEPQQWLGAWRNNAGYLLEDSSLLLFPSCVACLALGIGMASLIVEVPSQVDSTMLETLRFFVVGVGLIIALFGLLLGLGCGYAATGARCDLILNSNPLVFGALNHVTIRLRGRVVSGGHMEVSLRCYHGDGQEQVVYEGNAVCGDNPVIVDLIEDFRTISPQNSPAHWTLGVSFDRNVASGWCFLVPVISADTVVGKNG